MGRRQDDRGRGKSVVPPRWARRLLLPALLAVQLALACLLVALSVVGLVTALFDRRLRLFRLGALGIGYLTLEWAALCGLGAVWVRRPWHSTSWYDASNRRLVEWVLDRLQGVARCCVGFSVVVQDPPVREPLPAANGSGPVLVLARHGGPGDSFTLVWLLLRHGRRPKVVLKEALAWEPLIDVALSRLGACFLPANAGDAAERIGAMTAGLVDDDAMLLFPEGANWTPNRHRRAIMRLRLRHLHRAARAAALMDHVLPPHPTGVLECLEARPDLRVVVVAHTGLDKLTTLGAGWRALPFAKPMTLRWWPSAPVPKEPAARETWLTAEWAVVNEWIDARAAFGERVEPGVG